MNPSPSSATSSPWADLWHLRMGPHPTWETRCRVMQALGWTPTPPQTAFLRGLPSWENPETAQPASLLLASGGIQSGKTEATAMAIFTHWPWATPKHPIWVVGPDFDQARHEMRRIHAWAQQLKWMDGRPIAPRSPGTWQFTMKFTGGVIKTLSVANGDTERLSGESPSLVVMVEAGKQSFEAYWTCVERTFGKVPLILSGTMENSQRWFADLFRSWQAPNRDHGVSYAIPTWTNPATFPQGWKDPALQRQRQRLPPDRFWSRYGGKPGKTVGIVFREFDHGIHVRRIHFGEQPPAEGDLVLRRETPLEAWIDWGWDHHYVVLFTAIVNETVYVVDEIALQHTDDVTMVRHAQQHRLWPRVRRLILDVATKQHRGGLPTFQVWKRLTGLPCYAEKVFIDDGGQAVRNKLRVDAVTRQPQMWISPTCTRLIWELGTGYRFPVDSDGKTTADKPKDIDNDACKALAYGTYHHFPGSRWDLAPGEHYQAVKSTDIVPMYRRVRSYPFRDDRGRFTGYGA